MPMIRTRIGRNSAPTPCDAGARGQMVGLVHHAEVQTRRRLKLGEYHRLDASEILTPLPRRYGVERRLECGLVCALTRLFTRIIVRCRLLIRGRGGDVALQPAR